MNYPLNEYYKPITDHYGMSRPAIHDYKHGDMLIDYIDGIHGHMVHELKEIPINNNLIPGEDTGPDKTQYIDVYAKWILDGYNPPPIMCLVTDNGKIKIVDGHRRYYAHIKAKKPTILAWINDRLAVGTDPHGNTIWSAMTIEELNKSA